MTTNEEKFTQAKCLREQAAPAPDVSEAVELLRTHLDENACYCADQILDKEPCVICKTRAFIATLPAKGAAE